MNKYNIYKKFFIFIFLALFSVFFCQQALFVLADQPKKRERISSSDILIILERAREQYELGDYEWALKYYNMALEKDSSNPRVHFGLASAFLSLNKFELAIEHFKQVLDFDPAMIEAYYGLSCAYQALDNTQMANKYYRQALGLDLLDSKENKNIYNNYNFYNKVKLSSHE